MTDERPEPGADRLARVLAAVAAATPTPDRRDDLLAGLGPLGAPPAAEIVPLDLDGGGGRRSPRWPRVLLAAAVAVVVVGAVVALAGRGGRDGAVEVGPVDDPAVVGPRPGPGGATGWFLPDDGWTVIAVETDYLDVGEGGDCPCTTWVAARPGDGPAAIVAYELAAPGSDDEVDPSWAPVDVGGRDGAADGWDRSDGIDVMRVVVGDRTVAAAAQGVTMDEAAAVLDAWADMVEADDPVDVDRLPVPDGFVRGGLLTKEGTFETMVIVTARRDADGATVDYQVVPAGQHILMLFAGSEVVVDGAALVVTGNDGQAPFVLRTGASPEVLVGGTSVNGQATSAEDVADLAAGLHEVDTATWRAALPAATDPDVLAAPTLYDPPLTGP